MNEQSKRGERFKGKYFRFAASHVRWDGVTSWSVEGIPSVTPTRLHLHRAPVMATSSIPVPTRIRYSTRQGCSGFDATYSLHCGTLFHAVALCCNRFWIAHGRQHNHLEVVLELHHLRPFPCAREYNNGSVVEWSGLGGVKRSSSREPELQSM